MSQQEKQGGELEKEYAPGEEVPVSGTYRCTWINEEYSLEKGDRFPPRPEVLGYPTYSLVQET